MEAYSMTIAAISACICILGMVMNGAIIQITLKYSCLRKLHNYLLALCCLGDAMTESCTILPIILELLGRQIPVVSCFWLQLHGVIGNMLSYFCILFIALDRLFAVSAPVFYYKYLRTKSGILVLASNCVFTSPIAIYFAMKYYLAVLAHREENVFCHTGDAFVFDSQTFQAGMFLLIAITLLSFFAYVILWILLKLRDNAKNKVNNLQQIQQQQNCQQQWAKRESESSRQIYKSLVVIMAILLFGWLLFGLSMQLIPLMEATAGIVVKKAFTPVVSLFTAANPVVLFFCSSEYRKIMIKEFRLVKWLNKELQKSTTTNVIQMQMVSAASSNAGVGMAALNG